jgi:hypothetical protein
LTGRPAEGAGFSPDTAVGTSLPWLTPRRLILFVITWLAAFSVGSIAISNPFASEPNAGATPNYWHVMYLHGLLIGMVGLIALVTLEMFKTCCTSHVRVGIAGGVLFATILTAVGGIWDTRVPGAEVAMWVQIVGFFALDEILILLMFGFWQGWRARTETSRTLAYIAAWLAAASMFIAAIMGHIAGWILEFGDSPTFIGSYAKFAGVSVGTFSDNLIGSHSHEMAVASMALVLCAAIQRFGYAQAKGVARVLSRTGMGLVVIGIIAMTAAYVAMAFTNWVIPTYFQSANGTNGVAGDDLLTGIFVMGGGVLAVWPVVVSGISRARSWAAALMPITAAWAWTGAVIGVMVAGYWIEMNETFFGAGGQKAAGAAGDGIFTWLHQDVALFLMPALVAVLLLAEGLVSRQYQRAVGWGVLTGVTMLLLGGWVWVFVNSHLHGPGYVLSAVGMGLVGFSIALTVVAGVVGDGKLRLALTRRHAPVSTAHR